MKKILLSFAAPTMLLATLALADNSASYDTNSAGDSNVKEHSESTDANGTTRTQDVTKKVDVDSNGSRTTKVDVKDSTDPKGLFNKKTTEIKNKAVQKNGKTEYSHKKSVNGTTVEETDQKTEANP